MVINMLCVGFLSQVQVKLGGLLDLILNDGRCIEMSRVHSPLKASTGFHSF